MPEFVFLSLTILLVAGVPYLFVRRALKAEVANSPKIYLCPVGCGCTWRDNKDGTMSLAGPNSQSCDICENLPLTKLIPVYQSFEE